MMRHYAYLNYKGENLVVEVLDGLPDDWPDVPARHVAIKPVRGPYAGRVVGVSTSHLTPIGTGIDQLTTRQIAFCAKCDDLTFQQVTAMFDTSGHVGDEVNSCDECGESR